MLCFLLLNSLLFLPICFCLLQLKATCAARVKKYSMKKKKKDDDDDFVEEMCLKTVKDNRTLIALLEGYHEKRFS